MKISSIFSALISCYFLAACQKAPTGQTIELYPTSIEGGKIKVLSPQPMLQNQLPQEEIVLYKHQKPGIEFMVYCHELTPDEIARDGLDTDAGVASYGERTIRATADSRDGKLISAEPEKLAGRFPGLKASSSSKLGNREYLSRTKFFKVDNRLITLEVVGYDRELVLSSKADQFLDSLSVDVSP